MKKTLPVIIILVALSLLGLFVFQASWLKNLLEVRQGQISAKVKDAAVSVAFDLNKAVHPDGDNMPRRQDLHLGIDLSKLFRPFKVADRFSEKDVREKLQRALHSADLKDLNFEFGVIDYDENIELQSSGFQTAFVDKDSSNVKIFTPITSQNLTDPDSIGPYEDLILVIPDFKTQTWNSLKWIIIGAAFFMLIIIAAFYVTVRTLLHQKKLSEIKSDFINNMTHEFKTPLATISLAVDAIRNKKVMNDPEKLSYFSNIIKEENVRMNKHVETILRTALMEKKLSLSVNVFDTHKAIEEVVAKFDLQLKSIEANVSFSLDAEQTELEGDQMHFVNLVSNLVDNAIKYSKENLLLQIHTWNEKGYFLMSIKDNGIGMNRETVKRVFEKFYRAHTGNVHNVKGFGLGMNYVKSVVDAHHGRIKVDSTLGKGTVFTVRFPLVQHHSA